MELTEYGIWYDNYAEFAEDKPEVAEALLDYVDEGEWQNNELYYYPSLEDYAEYELTEGWYVDMGFDRDYNGAPDPLDYIQLGAFGEALINTGDASVTWCNWEGGHEVVTTSYGW